MARHKALTWAGSFRSEVDNWRHPPLALVLWPKRDFIRDICLVLAGSLFVALFAQIVIPLPFTPVPITGQTFAVVLTGALLGSKRGPLALLAYLAEGGIGLPFFTGGASGWATLLGPTGGYLVGFVFAACAVGWLCERGWDGYYVNAALAFLVGDALVFIFGLSWMAYFFGINQALAKGFIPFIPGDLIKTGVGALVITGLWRLVQKR